MTHSGDERILKRLSPGDTDPILVADFQAMSMSPRLSEMLSERIRGRAVFQIDPIGVLSEDRRYLPLPELAAACVAELLDAGADHGQVQVVGHCSASPLALRVAGLLSATRPVTAVLVNPTWPDDDHVMGKFSEFLGKFGPTTRTPPDLTADPELVVSRMERTLLDEVHALAASRGLSGSAGAFSDLVVWYRAWLAFVLAGRNDTQAGPAVGRAAVTVLSDSPSTLTVPGRNEDSYLVRELPAQPVGTVTPELAEIVATTIVPSLRTA
ncbi:alpha/beta fold hydrolase [Micromonospora sp. NPDC093244]|uniref:alpha/beta fold hydrolase n=1 Tax=Micromonospora sp. NPDC093244 TaxID=3155071 RepID=UPI00343913A1